MSEERVKVIRREDGYIFVILPENNNRQPLGISVNYNSLDECEDAKKQFCNMVEIHKLDEPKEPYIVIEKEEGKIPQYYFKYYDGEKLLFFRKSGYYQKVNCEKGVKAVYRIITKHSPL